MRPTAATTGAYGTRSNSSVTSLGNGQTLTDANVSTLTISGSDVTVRNVSVAGRILVTGDRVVLDRVTSKHIGVSSAQDLTVLANRVTGSTEDGLHITSDGGRWIRNVAVKDSLIDNPNPPGGAHYDGMQVRGVNGLTVECTVFDLGPYQDTYTAAVYLEPANGNNANVQIRNNWLLGGGYIVQVGSPISASFVGNELGGSYRWGACYDSGLTSANFSESGNTLNGAPHALCQ